MAGLQRSVVSFRRQGSSGIVWDDKLITEELNKSAPNDQAAEPEAEIKPPRSIAPIKTVNRSRSNAAGSRGFRARDTAAAPIEPPSPRVSACGFCGAFGKSLNKNHAAKNGKRKSR